MIIPMVRYGATGGNVLPAYTYTGTTPTFASDSDGNWELAFTGNCEINFSKIGTVDVFVVAGGMPGGAGNVSVGQSAGFALVYGGDGGKGGGRATSSGVQLSTGQNYTVTIGGSGQSSSAFGVTAESGAGSDCGEGASGEVGGGNWAALWTTGSSGGDDGAYAFGASTSLINSGRLYGAGGGGGAATVSSSDKAKSDGGATGGGAGGQDLTNYRNGVAGAANTGAGGGGGEATYTQTSAPNGHTGNGGAGGSGIVIIRNART